MEEIEELASICRRMESASSDEERLKAEYEFHMNLAFAARNPVITLIAEGLSSVLRRVLARRRLLVRSIPDAGRRADAAHMPIVDALRARDRDRAMQAMDEHFRITDELWARESARFLVSAPSEGLQADQDMRTRDRRGGRTPSSGAPAAPSRQKPKRRGPARKSPAPLQDDHA